MNIRSSTIDERDVGWALRGRDFLYDGPPSPSKCDVVRGCDGLGGLSYGGPPFVNCCRSTVEKQNHEMPHEISLTLRDQHFGVTAPECHRNISGRCDLLFLD